MFPQITSIFAGFCQHKLISYVFRSQPNWVNSLLRVRWWLGEFAKHHGPGPRCTMQCVGRNFQEKRNQLMVNCWFGARWFGILRVPLSNNPFHTGILGIQTTNPNQQLTMSWNSLILVSAFFGGEKRHQSLPAKGRSMISESLSNHIYLYSPSRKGGCSKYFQGLRPYLIVDDFCCSQIFTLSLCCVCWNYSRYWGRAWKPVNFQNLIQASKMEGFSSCQTRMGFASKLHFLPVDSQWGAGRNECL